MSTNDRDSEITLPYGTIAKWWGSFMKANGSILVLLLISSHAFAAFWSGDRLHDEMNKWEKLESGVVTKDARLSGGFFAGYVSAMFDVYESGGRICVASAAESMGITKQVVGFLKAHPESRSLPAVNQVEPALLALFKCRQSPEREGRYLQTIATLRSELAEYRGVKQDRDLSRNLHKAGRFMGYVPGAFEAYEINRQVCASASVDIGQVMNVVAVYLDNSTGMASFPAINIIYQALVDAFPCSP